MLPLRPLTRPALAALLFLGCAPARDRTVDSDGSLPATTHPSVVVPPSAKVVSTPVTPRTAELEGGVMPTRTPPLAVGALAPEIALIDQRGVTVSVQKALKQGPVALIFYRGRW